MKSTTIRFGTYILVFDADESGLKSSKLALMKEQLKKSSKNIHEEEGENNEFIYSINQEIIKDVLLWFSCDYGTDRHAEYLINRSEGKTTGFSKIGDDDSLPNSQLFFLFDSEVNSVYISNRKKKKMVENYLNRIVGMEKDPRITLTEILLDDDVELNKRFKSLEELEIDFHRDPLQKNHLQNQDYDMWMNDLEDNNSKLNIFNYIRSRKTIIKFKSMPQKNIAGYVRTLKKSPSVKTFKLKGGDGRGSASIIDPESIMKIVEIKIEIPPKGKLFNHDKIRDALLDFIGYKDLKEY